MKHQIEQVRQFMLMQGRELANQPIIPTESTQELIENLIAEELNELMEALDNDNLIETADALGDLVYVVLWAVNACGMRDHFEQIFEEIQASNMSKGHATHLEASQTLDNFKRTKGDYTARIVRIEENLYVVIRSDGKLVKNINYKEADLRPILHGKQFGINAEEIKEAVEESEKNPIPEIERKIDEPPSFWDWNKLHWTTMLRLFMSYIITGAGAAMAIWSPYIADFGGVLIYDFCMISFLFGGGFTIKMHHVKYQDYLRQGGWLW